MKTIEIKIDTTDTAMIGGGSWENCDPRASVERFLSQVRGEIGRYWPGYSITIEETTHENTIYVNDERVSFDASDKDHAGIEDDQAAIRDAISDVWSRADWYVEHA